MNNWKMKKEMEKNFAREFESVSGTLPLKAGLGLTTRILLALMSGTKILEMESL
jgi:hypothetical protein